MKSYQVMRAERNQIESMLLEGRSNSDIIKGLGISEGSFYRYRTKIFRDYAEQFRAQKLDNIAFYTGQLHNRLTKYLKLVEEKLKDSNTKDAIELIQLATEISKTIFDLNLQGLEILDTVKALDNKLQSKYGVVEVSNQNAR